MYAYQEIYANKIHFIVSVFDIILYSHTHTYPMENIIHKPNYPLVSRISE